MYRCILITRPNCDPLTNYLYYWCNPVIYEAKKKCFTILDLSSKKANKKCFESYPKKNKPSLFFLNGHGSSECVTGDEIKPLVEVGKNESIFNKAIVYARSCNAAKLLGIKSVEKGAIAFIGYIDKFYLGYKQSRITEPLKDSLAKLFLEPSNLIPISLLKGNSVNKSYEKSQNAMKKNLSHMLSTNASNEEKDCAFALFSNIKNQKIVGDDKARLY